MDPIHEIYFGMIYSIVRKQNALLLKDIAKREKLSQTKLYKEFLPTKKQYHQFIMHHCPPSPSNTEPPSPVVGSDSA
jgi:hypothetical protein